MAADTLLGHFICVATTFVVKFDVFVFVFRDKASLVTEESIVVDKLSL